MQVASTSALSRVGMISETRGAGAGTARFVAWSRDDASGPRRPMNQQLGKMHDGARRDVLGQAEKEVMLVCLTSGRQPPSLLTVSRRISVSCPR